jgi:hypothetical protein
LTFVPNFKNPSDALSDVPGRSRRREHREAARQTERVRIGIAISGDPRAQSLRTTPPYGIGLIPAIVISGIGPCTGTTVGTGTAQLYYLASPDSNAVTADADNAAVIVLNWFQNSGTIVAGTHIQIFLWSYAYWFGGADC